MAMAEIGKSLGVSQKTISRDLAGLDTMSKPERASGRILAQPAKRSGFTVTRGRVALYIVQGIRIL